MQVTLGDYNAGWGSLINSSCAHTCAYIYMYLSFADCTYQSKAKSVYRFTNLPVFDAHAIVMLRLIRSFHITYQWSFQGASLCDHLTAWYFCPQVFAETLVQRRCSVRCERNGGKLLQLHKAQLFGAEFPKSRVFYGVYSFQEHLNYHLAFIVDSSNVGACI